VHGNTSITNIGNLQDYDMYIEFTTKFGTKDPYATKKDLLSNWNVTSNNQYSKHNTIPYIAKKKEKKTHYYVANKNDYITLA